MARPLLCQLHALLILQKLNLMSFSLGKYDIEQHSCYAEQWI